MQTQTFTAANNPWALAFFFASVLELHLSSVWIRRAADGFRTAEHSAPGLPW